VETPTSVAAVKGTGFSTSFIGDTTKVKVFEGTVELSNDAGKVIINPGEIGISVKGSPPAVKKVFNYIEVEFKTPEGNREILRIRLK
jgi:ferric-dicitrate binding protein FerR (iron transport regulator)